MTYWHIISFSKLSAISLMMIFPNLLLTAIYLMSTESSILMEWELMSMNSLHLYFPVLLDKISLTFSCTVVLISFSVMLFSISYMSGDHNLEYFIIMVMLFVLSMNFLIYIPHLMFLLIGWDGLGLTSYLLVIYYQNDKSLGAGMVTAMSNRIGDSLLILASCWCFISGTWSFNFIACNMLLMSSICVVVGAMTKSAQIPFSAWLPAAMAAPTPVSSLVHSSTLVTAGVYLVIRFYPSISAYTYFQYFLFYMGVMTCLMASMSALYENDLKKIVALSTLSQLGVMMMSLGLGFPMLAFFHLITHALFKALLFICAGTIIHSSQNNQDIRTMGCLWYGMPITATVFNVANLALCGFPFMAGFYSKDLIVESFLYSKLPISTSIMAMASICLTAGYCMRMMMFTMWKPYKGVTALTTTDESKTTHASMATLLMGAITGGSLLFWSVSPFMGLTVLPMVMKTMVLILLMVIATIIYYMTEKSHPWKMSYFMSSIWFLSIITSTTTTGSAFSLSKIYYTQEFSWMEMMSGKGTKSLLSKGSSYMQKTQNMNFSKMFSLITFLMGMMMLLY